jgi:hypothetical protein
VVRHVDHERDAGVVAGGGNSGVAWCDQVLQAGQGGDDPAALGLPRLVLDPALGLTPEVGPDPLVTIAPDTDPAGDVTQVQLFTPADAAVPLIYVQWGGSDLAMPAPARPVTVGEIPGEYGGDPGGWSAVRWQMADGTDANVYAWGLEKATLLAFAEGLVRTDAGYEATDVPEGFVGTVFDEDVHADDEGYYGHYGYRSAGRGIRVDLDVWTEPLPTNETPLGSVLATADDADTVEVLGGKELLARYPNGDWTVAWTPGKCLATLRISGATRAEVDDIVAGLHTADGAEWAELLRSQPGR